jgi:hypothetical protein
MQCEITPPGLQRSQCQIPSQDYTNYIPLSKDSLSYGRSQEFVDSGSEVPIYDTCYGLTGKDSPEISQLHSLPCILSEAQLSLEYAFFNMYVDDGEGDPRDTRISPDTFAKWAVGAVERRQAGRIDLVSESVSIFLGQPLLECDGIIILTFRMRCQRVLAQRAWSLTRISCTSPRTSPGNLT